MFAFSFDAFARLACCSEAYSGCFDIMWGRFMVMSIYSCALCARVCICISSCVDEIDVHVVGNLNEFLHAMVTVQYV